MMPTVYLAGPIAGMKYNEATKWRLHAQDTLRQIGITCLSPLRFKEFLNDGSTIGNNRYQQPIASDKGIVNRDHLDVMRSDLILANLLGSEKVSIGTMIEFGWAHQLQKPVIAIMESGNIHDHPFVREIAAHIVPNVVEALILTRAYLEEDDRA